MLLLLLLAGHETTMNLIGNGTVALLEHPDQLAKLKENSDLMDNAVEEFLRFTSPDIHIAERYVLEDMEFDGQFMPKGTPILLNIASANRDEAAFDNAEQLDITRNPNRHLAFGMGIHYCLGAPLARLEARIAFTVLINRFPDVKLAVSSNELQWRSSSLVRGLKQLPLQLT
jgi:cytochrome P450 PksS